jgi:hypothetical protein
MLRSATMRKAGGVALASVLSSRIGGPISAAGLGIRLISDADAGAVEPHHRPVAPPHIVHCHPTSCVLRLASCTIHHLISPAAGT